MKLIKEVKETITITEPKDVYNYLKEFCDEDREHFIVLGLSSKNNIIYRDVVTIGTLNSSLVHAREVFKKAIMCSCNSIIIVRNHNISKFLSIF